VCVAADWSAGMTWVPAFARRGRCVHLLLCWRCVNLVRTDVSEERIASVIKVERIRELGTSLAVTSNWTTLLLLTTNVFPSSMFPLWWWRC
jgi:hypothetical protein